MNRGTVTVFIATTCSRDRQGSLQTAINSVLAQDCSCRLELIVNGNSFCPESLEQLRADPRFTVVYRAEASYSAALRFARTRVETEYFSFLDDDDEYLPGALSLRISYLERDGSLSCVVTNGCRKKEGVEDEVVKDPSAVESDPMGALFRQNWLASCGGLFRRDLVGLEIFDGTTKYYEWTMIAFRLLCSQKKIQFIDVSTYRINFTSGSLSHSAAYEIAEVALYNAMLRLSPPKRISSIIRESRTTALHSAADQHRKLGNLGQAWGMHLKCLVQPNGWRYLPFTRKLLYFASFGSRSGGLSTR